VFNIDIVAVSAHKSKKLLILFADVRIIPYLSSEEEADMHHENHSLLVAYTELQSTLVLYQKLPVPLFL
jgi:hypothetical protein